MFNMSNQTSSSVSKMKSDGNYMLVQIFNLEHFVY